MVVRLTLVLPLLLVVLLVTSLAACSKPEPEGAPVGAAEAGVSASRLGSCDRITAMSVCSEYTGSYLAQNEAVLTATCGKLGGTFAYAECPNTSVLGSCTLATGEVRKFYGGGGAAYDAPRGKKECEGSYRGKWKPFP